MFCWRCCYIIIIPECVCIFGNNTLLSRTDLVCNNPWQAGKKNRFFSFQWSWPATRTFGNNHYQRKRNDWRGWNKTSLDYRMAANFVVCWLVARLPLCLRLRLPSPVLRLHPCTHRIHGNVFKGSETSILHGQDDGRRHASWRSQVQWLTEWWKGDVEVLLAVTCKWRLKKMFVLPHISTHFV